MEVRFALLKAFKEPAIALQDNWVIVPGFMQAFEPFDEWTASGSDAAATRLINTHVEPQEQLYDFLANQDDEGRRRGIAVFSAGAGNLLNQLEKRRRELRGVSREMQWRIYGAKLFYDHQGIVAEQLSSIGKTIYDLKALGDEAIVKLVDNIPTLNVERNLAVKLEAQSRPLQSNDLLDMHSMCAAIPYSTHVVAENTFINLARQCKLDSVYGSNLSTELSVLADVYRA